ncbi:glycosyltransferase family 2 protein [Deinococcus roseus]|uniref:Rhamnosyltransferase n=1 Tax=Deinococcus roseus TaxID=392414 RepID=A0ABQ2D1F5_9DEIO|nr:glycosyltransferase family 2 protein [Deinococcus roseus]GGJ35348.1 rhamnosyltransferase [Deinococcus roseus]
MTTGAVIVTFNPQNPLDDLLGQLLEQCDRVLVVDNASQKDLNLQRFENHPGLTLIRLSDNFGIAHALNVGFAELQKTGTDFVFTFDQDSKIEAGFVQSALEVFGQNTPDTALVAPNFFDVNSRTYARFTLFENGSMESFQVSESDIGREIRTSFAITSGACIRMTAHQKAGPLRDDYFIDHVDSEYCLRLQKAGFKLLVNPAVCFKHAIGNRTVHRFLGLTFKPNNHSYLRRYYISRNGFHMAKLYREDFPQMQKLNLLRMIHEVGCVVLYETGKLKKLSYIVRGYQDARNNKLGKLT